MEKVIHQMWFQGLQSIPSKYRVNAKMWQDLHPDYKYILWDEQTISDFLKTYYSDYYKAWKSLDKLIKKCDCARYFILHYYGGIYADLDTIPLQPIDRLIEDKDLFNYQVILSEESNDPAIWKSEISRQIMSDSGLSIVVGNAILISKKESSFWIEFAKKSFEKKHLTVLESFSTWHLTRFVSCWKGQEVKVLPYEFLLGSDATLDGAYVVHGYDATWFNHDIEKPWEG